MASGLGRRFGGNKLMADFRGQPLICRALDATDGLFARRVVVTRHEAVEALCHRRGIEVVRHHLPHRSDTVRLGLEKLGDGLSGCLFCPGDQPLLSRQTVQRMAQAAAHDPEAIWQLACGEIRGTPVLFPSWAFERLRTLPQGKGGSVVIKEHPGQVRLLPARGAYELMDVDTPEELVRLEEMEERTELPTSWGRK